MNKKWFGFIVHSIRGRIIAGVVLLHAILMGLVVIDMVGRQQAFMQEQLAGEGSSLAQTLAINAPSWLISNDLTGLNEVVDSLKATPIGIPADRAAHIFDAFTQADNSTTRRFGGTGLGLTISRHLIELMDGVLHLESTEGQWCASPSARINALSCAAA